MATLITRGFSLLMQVALVVICVAVAKAKGRNPWLWGILGFFFGFLTLIVIAALPSGAEAVQGPSAVPGRVVTPASFAMPVVGLVVGLIFAAVILEATATRSNDLALLDGASEATRAQLRKDLGIGSGPRGVLFWPVSTGLQSYTTRQSVTDEMRRRLPITYQMVTFGAGLSILLGWGLALGLRRPHPGITAGRLYVAFQAAVPVMWWGLLILLVLARGHPGDTIQSAASGHRLPPRS